VGFIACDGGVRHVQLPQLGHLVHFPAVQVTAGRAGRPVHGDRVFPSTQRIDEGQSSRTLGSGLRRIDNGPPLFLTAKRQEGPPKRSGAQGKHGNDQVC